MTQPIQREGSWWSQTDGGWMRWNEATQSWEGQAAGPPPPPPPGPLPTAPSGPAAATPTPTLTAEQPVPTYSPRAPEPPKPRRNKALAIVAAVVLVAAAGAGAYFLLVDDADTTTSGDEGDGAGGGDAGSGRGEGVTKQEFIAQADALCTAASKKFDDLTEPASPEEAGPFLTKAIAINEALYADLTALEPPPGDNGEAAEVFAGLKALTGQMKTLLDSIEAQDANAIQANYDQLGVFTDAANAAAAAYGLVACAS
jgi:hypothetical protein